MDGDGGDVAGAKFEAVRAGRKDQRRIERTGLVGGGVGGEMDRREALRRGGAVDGGLGGGALKDDAPGGRKMAAHFGDFLRRVGERGELLGGALRRSDQQQRRRGGGTGSDIGDKQSEGRGDGDGGVLDPKMRRCAGDGEGFEIDGVKDAVGHDGDAGAGRKVGAGGGDEDVPELGAGGVVGGERIALVFKKSAVAEHELAQVGFGGQGQRDDAGGRDDPQQGPVRAEPIRQQDGAGIVGEAHELGGAGGAGFGDPFFGEEPGAAGVGQRQGAFGLAVGDEHGDVILVNGDEAGMVGEAA